MCYDTVLVCFIKVVQMKTKQLIFTAALNFLPQAIGTASWRVQFIDKGVVHELLPGDTSMYGDTLYVDLQYLTAFSKKRAAKVGNFFKLSNYYDRTNCFMFTVRRVA